MSVCTCVTHIRTARRFASRIAVAALLGGGMIIGCTPVKKSHGYAPSAEQLTEITAGSDTRATVTQKVGRPSTLGLFGRDVWYYVAQKTETFAFYAPERTEQRVVAIAFDDADRVTSVNQYGLEDGRIINLVTRTTPTLGKELTILQQLFGNIGRFNTPGTGGGVLDNVPGQ